MTNLSGIAIGIAIAAIVIAIVSFVFATQTTPGADGADGAPGADGTSCTIEGTIVSCTDGTSSNVQGPLGVLDFYRVSANGALVNANHLSINIALCGTGDIAVGGGVLLVEGNAKDMRVIQNYPSQDNGWTGAAWHDGVTTSQLQIQVWAVCANTST